jgi:hypothetical protein
MPHPLAALAALALAKKAAALAIVHAYGVGRLYRRALTRTGARGDAAALARVRWLFRAPGRALRAAGVMKDTAPPAPRPPTVAAPPPCHPPPHTFASSPLLLGPARTAVRRWREPAHTRGAGGGWGF